MVIRNWKIVLVALAFGQALPYACAQEPLKAQEAWLGLVKAGKQAFEAVQSYEYELKSYSKRSPETFYQITYKELGDAYYFSTKIVSPDPKRQHAGSVETWNGERALRLRRETRILYINSKPYDFTNEWRNLNGLWDGFRFLRATTSVDRIKSPQLRQVKGYFSNYNPSSKPNLKIDNDSGMQQLELQTDGGLNLMDGVPEKVATYFDLAESMRVLPVKWLLSTAEGVQRSMHVVVEAGVAEVKTQKGEILKMHFPRKVEITYLNPKGEISNVVVDEYSQVRFNQADLSTFDIDPSEAEKIIDEANGGKLIMVPK